MFGLLDGLIFPAPKASYSEEEAPWPAADVIWLRPQRGAYQFPAVVVEPVAGVEPVRVVLYCHGNACDVGEVYPSFKHEATRWRALIVLIEYPGYGVSPGRASREGVDAHLWAAYTHFTTLLNVPSERVVLFGCSVGTGPVCALAARVQASGSQVGALVLLSAYTSIRDAAAALVGSVAYLVLTERWDNCAALRQLACPVLLLHGTQDEIIPFAHGERLAALRRRERLPVAFHAQEGGSHNVYRVREDYSDPIAAFLSKSHVPEIPLGLRDLLATQRDDTAQTRKGCLPH